MLDLNARLLASMLLASSAAACGSESVEDPSQPMPPLETGTTYYLSPDGDDDAAGTTPERAWRTLARASQQVLEASDAVLLQGGATFEGTVTLDPENAHGSAAAPVSFGSYGEGRAHIRSASSAFVLTGVAGVSIADLVLEGTVYAYPGVVVTHDEPSTIAGLYLRDVEASGFYDALTVFTGEAPATVSEVRIERLSAHDNAGGIALYGHLEGAVRLDGEYGIRDVDITDSELYDNTGLGIQNEGFGIFMVNASNVHIARSAVHDNGGDNQVPGTLGNGPSAITIYDGHACAIEHNEIYRQHRDVDGPTDNAGIDLWATDSLFQYNYVHHNEGWGMLLGAGDPSDPDEAFPWPSERITIRYNVLEANARRLPDSPIPEELGAHMFINGPVRDFDVYQNTFYSPNAGGPVPAEAQEGMIDLVEIGERTPQGMRFFNNLFIAEDEVRFADSNALSAEFDAIFRGNAYVGGGPVAVRWGFDEDGWADFPSVELWSEATGQERIADALVAVLTDATAVCGGSGEDLWPEPTESLAGYRLPSGSPLIDAGRDLAALEELDVGTRDYFGNVLAGAPDIGAHEASGDAGCE